MNTWGLTMLEVQDLVIRYGPFLAVDSVGLQVNAHEIVGLIGPNGAGKSSIARAIGGLQKPTSGQIRLGGTSILATSAHERIRLGLSLVPEGRGLFPQMSVEENLQMGGYALQQPARRRELMDRCFELFPILKNRRHQIAGTMSGGQQQMLAVSMGLMGDPKLCIFDEPSLGLAPIVIQQIGETLAAMRKLDLTVLLIEQNAKLASTVADRIYVLSAGRIAYHDTPQRLAAQPEVLETFLSA
jgi:branched-chain amino acid transport system ATP-binding protein